MAKRSYSVNPMIWRKRSKAEIEAANKRASQSEHTHAYYQHRTLATHVQCACGWLCRRIDAPVDLLFIGPAR